MVFDLWCFQLKLEKSSQHPSINMSRFSTLIIASLLVAVDAVSVFQASSPNACGKSNTCEPIGGVCCECKIKVKVYDCPSG
jgi:hypothetical protein